MILQLYKKSRIFNQLQSSHNWIKQDDLLELRDKTAIIVGFGNVGREIAKRLRPFDVYIIGIDLCIIETNLADEFYLYEDIDKVINRADILILALGLTKKNYHFLNKLLAGLIEIVF